MGCFSLYVVMQWAEMCVSWLVQDSYVVKLREEIVVVHGLRLAFYYIFDGIEIYTIM